MFLDPVVKIAKDKEDFTGRLNKQYIMSLSVYLHTSHLLSFQLKGKKSSWFRSCQPAFSLPHLLNKVQTQKSDVRASAAYMDAFLLRSPQSTLLWYMSGFAEHI